MVDSDEEEESQSSLLKDIADLQKAVPEIGDTQGPEPQEEQDGSGDIEEEVSAIPSAAAGGPRGGSANRDEDEATTTSLFERLDPSSPLLHGPSHVPEESRSIGYDDFDELQQDYSKPTRAAQPKSSELWGPKILVDGLRAESALRNQGLHAESVSSSPLSDISTGWRPFFTLPGTCLSHHDLGIQVHNENLSIHPSPVPEGHSDLLELPTNDEILETRGPARNLRHRNPIQLHPYAIEGEKYRQVLKARGVIPLRIAQMEAEAASASRSGFQHIEYNGDESQLTNSDVEHQDISASSPLLYEESTTGIGNEKDMFIFGDDDLPDMNSLLSRSPPKHVDNGNKRRKIALKGFRMPPGLGRDKSNSMTKNQTSPNIFDDDVMFDVPPSPPRSGNQTPQAAGPRSMPVFRMPRRSKPNILPTPVTSSEPRKRQPLDISEDDQSDDLSHITTGTADSDGPAEIDDSSSEDDRSLQLQRVQRKMRGVLPASWLKLDLKSRAKKPDESRDAQWSPSPERSVAQRGVARPVVIGGSRKYKAPISKRGSMLLSDVDSSPEEKYHRTQRPRPRERHKPNDRDVDGFFTGRWGEAGEDDQVDAMLPTAKRGFAHRRRQKKHQARIEDSGHISWSLPPGSLNTGDGSRADGRSHVHQSKITERFAKGRTKKNRLRPPRLGILDAPSVARPPQGATPQFLKIASRTARSRHDKGRHSPSRKYLRMATKYDDDDTNATLRGWREGTILPIAMGTSHVSLHRKPLYPRSINGPMPQRVPSVERNVKEVDVPITRGASEKPQARPGRPRKLQTSLDHLVERQKRSMVGAAQPSGFSRPQQPMEKPKTRGQIVSWLQTMEDSRPAMLEYARGDENDAYNQAAFQRDLSRVDNYDNDAGLPNVLLRRFFADGERRISILDQPSRNLQTSDRFPEKKSTTKKGFPHRSRKRRPQHVDIAKSWLGKPSAHTVLDDHPDESPGAATDAVRSRDVLFGLVPFRTRYNISGITPLPTGTCFSESTFIGSGTFARTLRIQGLCDMDVRRGFTLLRHQNRTFRWGPWNESVATELGEVLETVGQTLANVTAHDRGITGNMRHEEALALLRSIIEYFSDHLSFLDPVDRAAYLQRCKIYISEALFGPLNQDQPHGNQEIESPPKEPSLRASTLSLVLANQLQQIARHELVPRQLQEDLHSLMLKAGQRTLDLAFNGTQFETLAACITNVRDSNPPDYVIRQPQDSIEAFVVAQHVLGAETDGIARVWERLQRTVPKQYLDGSFDVRLAEQSWNKLFTLLPLFELDAQGVLETGRRFKVAFDYWTWAKQLVTPVLEASLRNPQGQSPSFNPYCRALFGRCLHLINGWGWRRCESIIGTMFDFFARNNLAHLRNEESHGSPLFLGRLDRDPVLAPDREDQCFHILLKIIASGIKHLKQLYSEKRIRDIVWRLMPNHGRAHPKEEAIRQEDIDALRNHHDLLCTLYWASPPSCRPRLTVIRNLVDLETSHREVCHINIRAWFNLVKFQLSASEPLSNLEAFAEWHDDLLTQILRQHNLARTEAEEQVRSAQTVDGLTVSREMLESTVAMNQQQVEAILSDALLCLKLAMDAANNLEAQEKLLSVTLTRIFDLYDTGRPRVTKIIVQALEVLHAYAASRLAINQQLESRHDNDDSQDYGDWSAFYDNTFDAAPQGRNPSALASFQEPLRHLLSNCFGADVVPEDVLLLKMIDVWTAVAQVLVGDGNTSWADYLDRYGKDSWSSLRDTEQTRKYSAYYWATLIEKNEDVYRDHKVLFLTSWIGSLVERESLLKFQHRFTNALFNVDPQNPLLRNPPFWKDVKSDRFEITFSEFSERRLSLISSILSNMRVSLETAVLEPSVNAGELRQNHKDLLRHLMAMMKHNYQELGHGSKVRGAYVDFVHSIVELLQQHTSTICPIDRFFTDNGGFPLPAADPTYVVGQLKNYGLRLQDPRIPKQLAIFLQSVSERAAIDGQQAYLVGQLHTATSHTFEDGLSSRPTLRSFIVKAIVPAYIEVAFSTMCGWIVATPYLQALTKGFGELLLDLDGASARSVSAVASIISAFLDSLRASLGRLADAPGQFQKPEILRILSACYRATTALLPSLDYLVRLSGSTRKAVADIEFLKAFASQMNCILCAGGDETSLDIEINENIPMDHGHGEIRKFATEELKETLTRNWIYHAEQYFVMRGTTRSEVVVDIGLFEEEKVELANALQEFWGCLAAMLAFGGEDDKSLALQRKVLPVTDELLF